MPTTEESQLLLLEGLKCLFAVSTNAYNTHIYVVTQGL